MIVNKKPQSPQKTSSNSTIQQSRRRSSWKTSLDAVQAFSSTRRRTIPQTQRRESNAITFQSLAAVYNTKTLKAYRQRRALYYRNRGKKSDKNSQNIEGKPRALERFRKLVRLIIILRNAFKNIVLYAQKGQHVSETTLSLRANTAKGTYDDLMFDSEVFKCQFKDSFPTWAKLIADKKPSNRTKDEIKLFVRLMQQLKGFRRYSPDVQASLCKVLKYDRFGRRRVIIRKGHIAQRLYFIFSGSVCVTDDEDEDTAFSNLEDDKACLKRGDYFGELAFLRKLRRAASIVCLEQTELLSVSKEDFFSTGIDQCFTDDLDKRIQFFANHRLFTTWTRKSLSFIAGVSRVHAYHSDDVIVRNSRDCSWIYFIVKGQANVLRLVDLKTCPAYQKYCLKAQRTADSSMSYYRSDVRPATPLALTTYPILEEDEEEASPAIVKPSHSDINIKKNRIITTRSKSACVRSSPQGKSVGVGVYMVLDRLTAGQLFGAWSVLNHEDEKDRKRFIVKERRFILLSGGCEVIKMPKKEFQREADHLTIDQLRALTEIYPSDNELSQTYIKQSDWRCYREELVEDIISRKQAIKYGLKQTQPKTKQPSAMIMSGQRSSWIKTCTTAHPVTKLRRTPTPQQCRPTSRSSQRPGSSSRYPLNPEPLVGEKLVIAKTSHKSLVLTHGGMRCNDYIGGIIS